MPLTDKQQVSRLFGFLTAEIALEDQDMPKGEDCVTMVINMIKSQAKCLLRLRCCGNCVHTDPWVGMGIGECKHKIRDDCSPRKDHARYMKFWLFVDADVEEEDEDAET